jgi:hypothetical protein
MFLTFSRRNSQSIFAYFAQNFILSIAPTILLGISATLFFKGHSPSPYFAGNASLGVIWQFLLTGLVIPFVESFILIYPTVIASSAIKNERFAALVGALPLIAMHGLIQWQKAIVIGLFFYVQAFSYLELRNGNFPFWKRFSFVFLMHALWNLLLLSFLFR